VAWVGYVEVFWNTGHEVGWSVVIALVGLWLPALGTTITTSRSPA
jgi:basic amino acid/polyamine antiporter, APA family